MRVASSVLRPLSLAVLAVAVVGVSGCKWFKKDSPEYAMSEETRPLEVPPDLNLPSTAGAMKLPPSVSASQVSAAVSSQRWRWPVCSETKRWCARCFSSSPFRWSASRSPSWPWSPRARR